MPKPPTKLRDFESLLQVVSALRGPGGCPWDREQTHSTLTRFALEEASELAEAIDQGDDAALCEELGDVLLQVILHAQIASERKAFGIADVVERLNEKMIRRHPHVFGDVTAATSGEVMANWAAIKAKEKSKSAVDALFDYPPGLSALLVAQKIGEKSGRFQFDWTKPAQVFEKLREEFLELEEAMTGSPTEQAHEIGDMLFCLVQLARHLRLDSEQVLRQTNRRFERRFRKMIEIADQQRQDLTKIAPEDVERLWQEAKKRTSD